MIFRPELVEKILAGKARTLLRIPSPSAVATAASCPAASRRVAVVTPALQFVLQAAYLLVLPLYLFPVVAQLVPALALFLEIRVPGRVGRRLDVLAVEPGLHAEIRADERPDDGEGGCHGRDHGGRRLRLPHDLLHRYAEDDDHGEDGDHHQQHPVGGPPDRFCRGLGTPFVGRGGDLVARAGIVSRTVTGIAFGVGVSPVAWPVAVFLPRFAIVAPTIARIWIYPVRSGHSCFACKRFSIDDLCFRCSHPSLPAHSSSSPSTHGPNDRIIRSLPHRWSEKKVGPVLTDENTGLFLRRVSEYALAGAEREERMTCPLQDALAAVPEPPRSEAMPEILGEGEED